MTNSQRKLSRVFYPWRAYRAQTETIPLTQSGGRIAASTIRQYPPGIPDIIPGMEYTDNTIDHLISATNSGSKLVGMHHATKPKVDVVLDKEKDENRFDISTFRSHEIPDSMIHEIADFFRLNFSGAPYFHFAFHESEPLKALPHNLDFSAYSITIDYPDEKIRAERQDCLIDFAIRTQNQSNSDPELIILPKGFHRWTDKNICRIQIRNRLSDPGYVTLVRDRSSRRLKGILHARMGTLERLFTSEEWSNPHIFSAYEDTEFQDESSRFFEKMKFHFNLLPSDTLMTISAQLLTPDAQGGEIFYRMMRSMALQVSPEHARLPVLSEIPSAGTAHALNTALNERIVYGVLKNGHPVVYCTQFAVGLFPLINEKKHWQHILRKAAKEKNQYRKKFFVPLPTDNKNVVVKPNGKLGLAVFAISNIPAGSRIAVFTGETYYSKNALGLPPIMRNHAIQVGPEEYIFGRRGLAHCICHSCDPNCGVRDLTEIFAVRDISSGEQISWDYRCSENSDWVMEPCLCGSDRCTGSVRNYDSLPESLKSEYKQKGMISDWLTSV